MSISCPEQFDAVLMQLSAKVSCFRTFGGQEYKQLESTIQCELHRGHCYINRTSGHDNHCRFDHSEMTLWAKKIVSRPYLIIHKCKLTEWQIGPWSSNDLQPAALHELRPWAN